jgi:hypothetical protein
VLWFGNPSSQKACDAMMAGLIGMVTTPNQGNAIPDGAAIIRDNGCGPPAGWVPGQDTYPGAGWPGVAKFDAWLRKGAADAELMSRTLFAVAPDVVGNAAWTLRRSALWIPRMRRYGYRIAVAAQDGAEDMPEYWDLKPDVLFLGGSVAWKLGAGGRRMAAQAHARGVDIHVGKVNTFQRMVYVAKILGAATSDGTTLAQYPGTIDEVLRFLKRLGHLPEPLFLLDGEATA